MKTSKRSLIFPLTTMSLPAGVKSRVAETSRNRDSSLSTYISAITPPEEVQKMIDERSGWARSET